MSVGVTFWFILYKESGFRLQQAALVRIVKYATLL